MSRRKHIGVTLVLALLTIAMVASPLFAAGAKEAKVGGKEKVDFWYLWGGDEGALIEQMIDAYNKSQDRYEVVGLSVPDQQKIVTAISGGQGPDVTDDFGSNVPKYADEYIAMALDEFIARDKMDMSDFVDAALAQQRHQGKVFALPISVNVYALYYNKDILTAGGVNTLPKTLEELNDLSMKLTKVQGGQITQLGSTIVPAPYWPFTYTYAAGTNFGAPDGSVLTPSNAGFRKALEFVEAQVKAYGRDALNNFVSSGVSVTYTPQDVFTSGKQAFRIDGPWFYNMAKEGGVNFDLMPVPGSASTGGYGHSLLDTSMLYIPTTAKNKDGAWDFVKYMTVGEGAKLFVLLKGDLPAIKSLTADNEVKNATPFNEVFLDIIAQNNFGALPQYAETQVYNKNVMDAVNDVLLGSSVDKALADLEAKMRNVR